MSQVSAERRVALNLAAQLFPPHRAITVSHRDDGSWRACMSRNGIISAAVAQGAVAAVVALAKDTQPHLP